MQDNWWSNKADELQALADRQDSRFYEELRTVFGPNTSAADTSAAAPLRSEDGSTLFTDRALIMQKWNDFKDLLNRPSSVSMESLAKVHQKPIQEHLANPLTLLEVRAATKAMKSNEVPGPDGIPAEIWKSSEALAEQMHKLLAHIWEKEDVPQQFKDANVVTIWKRKGSKSDCNNYRGISLLSITGKILGKVLLKNLTTTIIEPVLPESQSGFRENHGTTDMIFCPRPIQEKSREQH